MRKQTWVKAVLPLVCVSWAAWQVAADPAGDDRATRSQSVPCEEAMSFADRNGLPAGAYDARCEDAGALDTMYDVRFRIPRSGLDTWLAEAYPGLRMTSPCPGSPEHGGACGHVDLAPPADGGAVAIDVVVEYEKNDTALVHFRPFRT
ncbi:hypothetical protein ACH4GE_35825 [Streptomyces tendae]|uniref:hypothetical protein n=1 Tax=Streptomyces tendae TaxID=1932 RepID=UPI003796408B